MFIFYLTASGSLVGAKTSDKKGHHHGKGGSLHRLHEGNTSKCVHDLRHFLGVGNRADNLRSHVFNVAVANDIACTSHGSLGGLLDLLLGLGHGDGYLRDDFREGVAELLCSVIGQHSNGLEGQGAGLPGNTDLGSGEEVAEDDLGGVGAHLVDNCLHGTVGASADKLVLVSSGCYVSVKG